MKLKILAVVVYFAAIAVLAAFPFTAAGMKDVTDIYVVNFRLDHILHLLAFFPLYPLGFWVFNPTRISTRILLLTLCLLLATLAEGVQDFLLYRSFNLADLLSNATGVVLGFLAFLMLRETILSFFPKK